MKKHKIIYLDSAFFDLAEIRTYLDEYSLTAWSKLIDKLEKQTKGLEDFPFSGVKYRTYRRLVCDDYLVFYKVNEDSRTVEIHRILHGSRDIARHLTE